MLLETARPVAFKLLYHHRFSCQLMYPQAKPPEEAKGCRQGYKKKINRTSRIQQMNR
jgi:hypothetical protein